MASHYFRRDLMLVTLLAQSISTIALAQKPPSPPCPSSQQGGGVTSTKNQSRDQSAPDPCIPAGPKEPSPADQFPFPGETAKPAPAKVPNAMPDAPTEGKHPSTADQFPFPGAAPPMPGTPSTSGSSGNSDASSSSSSSSNEDPADTTAPPPGPPLDDKGDNPAAAARSVRRKLPKVQKLQSDEERAAEDLDVAKFYEQFGDLNAAYLRARDAVKLLPSDADAHFVLGHLAEKLNKRDEAIREYNSYLQLEPDGEKIKQAHKALSQLERP